MRRPSLPTAIVSVSGNPQTTRFGPDEAVFGALIRDTSVQWLFPFQKKSLGLRKSGTHLRRERDAMFTFLYCPGLDATNYRAEQAIRPMVVTRKVWGGNRTEPGAHTQSVLVSILQTCSQQLRPASAFLQQLLHLPKPQALELILPTPR